ncbi:MAG: ABC transporter substrate-binding protein [Proteobacteria bacterium]|nr:ABC transporter substrate-binding protein [Pseudomonadota bacterium]
MQIFDGLMTRDENMNPMPQLAETIEQSQDGKTYVFKLKAGVKFHNGKPLSTADVVASYNRYKELGIERGILDVVDKWEAKDASTFVITLKAPQPTFLENLSSFGAPIVIVPAENTKAPAMQLEPIGTGPFQFVEFVADSHVKVKRFDGYIADTRYKDLDGFGGYRAACLDSVVFRIVTEPGARVAGLETGELQGVEDVPTKSQDRLKQNKNVVLKPLNNFWIQISIPNFSAPPTDNLKVRQAVQAALDMDEIMEAATDGAYKLNIGFLYPGQNFYSETGKETYNQKNAAKAKKLLAEGGYKGEELILLTNRDYTSMYNAALVMSEQLKAIGMNAKLLVLDWPASSQMQQNSSAGWNWYFTGWGTPPAVGGAAALRNLAPPYSTYKPKTPEDADKEFIAAFREIENNSNMEARKAGFVKAQARALDQVMALPFGSLTKVQAVRANVQNFRPYRIPRMSNVYFSG